MSKKLLTIILIFAFCILHFAQSASAHILQTDGTIGAVMHIDPNDDPIAGQQASFFFAFKDTTNRFDPKKCDCKIAIVEESKTIYASSLFQNSSTPTLDNASLFYTFPTPDAYQVIITGSPTVKNAFQSFQLVYNVRAEQPTSSSSQNTIATFFSTHTIHFAVAIVMLIFICFVLVQKVREKNTSIKK